MLNQEQIQITSNVLFKELAQLNKKSQDLNKRYQEQIIDYDIFVYNFNKLQQQIDKLRRIVVELNHPGSDYDEE